MSAAPQRLMRVLRRARLVLAVRRAGGTIGRRADVRGQLPIIDNQGALTLGERTAIYGRQHRVQIGVARGAALVIGDDVLLNQGVNIHASTRVEIGPHCKLADLVAIYDTDFHDLEPGSPVRRAPVVLGRNVWLGRAAVVLPGVTIGDHAVVAAGAVVSRDVPPSTLVAGVPAKVIRQLRTDEGYVRG